ncbi:MAG: L-threonine 3-dehydrogenase [Pseudomonadota bacterium]|nr:L-threonine 3-dehydrogenase [Pseudomonadota bacterium]
MKALVKDKAAVGITMLDVPDLPAPQAQEVLIKIMRTAICGTDIHIYNWDAWAQRTIPVPLVIGHEFVGKIAAIGDGVKNLQVGQRVTGEGHITCGLCRNCLAGQRHLCRQQIGVGVERQGAFAEYLLLPQTNVYPLDQAISDDLASIYDPLGNATHAALEFDLVGEDVLVTGAGPIGLMVAAIAKHAGARHVVITDVNTYRLQLAEQLGVSKAVHAKQSLVAVMKELGMSEGFDIGFEMSGNGQALTTMLACLNNGAYVSLLGIFPDAIKIDWTSIVMKGITLRGIFGRKMFDTWYKTTSMLQSGLNIAPVITHHFPINAYQQAFKQMQQGTTGKVILEW